MLQLSTRKSSVCASTQCTELDAMLISKEAQYNQSICSHNLHDGRSEVSMHITDSQVLHIQMTSSVSVVSQKALSEDNIIVATSTSKGLQWPAARLHAEHHSGSLTRLQTR